MKKIITVDEAVQISKTNKDQHKKIILVGGCFDVLHAGHISFLENAKKNSDLLFLLLESDENIRKIKGENRPINSQKNRSIVLGTLSCVDYIIPLEGMTKNQDYDKLIVQIKPDYIALTKGDKNIIHREKQCELVNAKLVQIEKVAGLSSSNFIEGVK